MKVVRASIFAVLLMAAAPVCAQQGDDHLVSPESPISSVDSTPAPGVQWKSLFNQSFRLLLIEHAFRYATEPGTRDPGQPFFQGYLNSVGALHGWADGDPFYVNYVGHPMQGAVSGYLWTLNDNRYKQVEFGKNPDYWKSRIRAGAFAWAYSEQMEIGPFSEASIGNVQATYPQQGFVDHVVTPAIGLGWMIAEDALDRYLVRYVERKTQNRLVRVLVRGGANPSRSLANVVSGQWPWARPRDHADLPSAVLPKPAPRETYEQQRSRGVAPIEFAANAYALGNPSGTCAGGGATAALRVSSQWQMVLDVNGCKMTGLEKNLSGDSLSYMAGSRWTPPVTGQLVPYVQVLFGGNKLTQELVFPQQESYLTGLAKSDGSEPPARSQYAQQFEHDGFAIAAGMGLDYNFNRALAFRLVAVDYTRSWASDMNGFTAPQGFQFKTGLVLHMGNW
ncbi:MAG TPA: hypothetical protein VLM42_05855 [Bryobacteraceae bacterium]|nr:hypothetical protein [Bryobacteraceae bacterium]